MLQALDEKHAADVVERECLYRPDMQLSHLPPPTEEEKEETRKTLRLMKGEEKEEGRRRR